MSDREANCVYFEKPGPRNTQRTLELARERALALGIDHILVATTSGETGALAAELFVEHQVTVVTHSTGFHAPNDQELEPRYRARIEEAGGRLLTCQHALGGVGRAVRRKLGTYQVDEIIAFVLRTFGQGMKVACEITVMAADAGLVPAGEEIIAIGGSGRGADTAAVILAANAQDFFDLRVVEIICKPRLGSGVRSEVSSRAGLPSHTSPRPESQKPRLRPVENSRGGVTPSLPSAMHRHKAQSTAAPDCG